MAKDPSIIPLSNKSSVAIVFEQLEELIADGFWKEDERILSEAELCARFNVGRSTIREALNMLKARNLIYTVPGLGTFVANPAEAGNPAPRGYVPDPRNENDLLNVMELRLTLEPMNAAFAARRASRAQIEELQDKNAALIDSGDSSVFAEGDLAFHLLVAKATGNPMLEDAMKVVRKYLLEQQILTSQEPWRRKQAGKFHGQIIEAILRRDDTGAEDIMREHMEETYLYIKSLITGGDRQSGRWTRRKPGKKGRATG